MPRSSRRGPRPPSRQLPLRFFRDDKALMILPPSRRVVELRKERDLLIAKVERKLRTRDEVETSVQLASTLLGAKLSPALAGLRKLSADLRRQFRLLLASPLSAPARRAVRSVFLALEDTGALGADEPEEEEDAAVEAASYKPPEPEAEAQEQAARRKVKPSKRGVKQSDAAEAESAEGANSKAGTPNGGSSGASSSAGESASEASRDSANYGQNDAAQDADDDSSSLPGAHHPKDPKLKALFRKLAALLHPDRGRDGGDKTARTEAMKQLTQAYARGNLAAILAIEQQWASGKRVGRVNTEAANQEELLHSVKQLREQLRSIERDLREIRRESPLAGIAGFRHEAGADPMPVIERLVADVTREQDQLQKITDLVVAFRERRITLADFTSGPFGARR